MVDINRVALHDHYSIIGTKGQIPNLTTKGGGDTNTQHLSRVAFKTPGYPVTDIRFVYASLYMAGSAAGEGAVGNDMLVSCALEGNGHAGRQMYMNGVASFTVPNSRTGIYITDPIPDGIVTPYTVMQARTLVTVTAAQFWPIGTTGGTTTGAVKAVSGLESQLLSSGAPTGTAEVGIYGPMAIIGRAAGRRSPSVIILGASIEDGTSDVRTADVDGVIGYAARGLINASGGAIPHAKLTMGSENLTKLDLVTGRIRQMFYRFGSDAYFGCSLQSNEVVLGSSLVTMQGLAQKAWAVAKANGCRVWAGSIPPRCTGAFSSGAALAAAGQTIISNFGVGSIAEQYNTWQLAQVGQGLLDGVFDTYALCVDPVVPWKWRSDLIMSDDGVHIYTNGVVNVVAPAFATFAAANFLS